MKESDMPDIDPELDRFLYDFHLWKRKYRRLKRRASRMESEAEPYELKNLDEIRGVLEFITLDGSDPSIGYCYISMGEDIFKVRIIDPERTLMKTRSKNIIYGTKVALFRMDGEGMIKYYIRSLEKTVDTSEPELGSSPIRTVSLLK